MIRPLILIPARLGAVRLPGKPLADIHGAPMIIHVWRRAQEANVGPVVVATDSPDIQAAVEAHGGQALLTSPDHPSGSDRCFEALNLFDPKNQYDIIVNLQGDLPTIEPEAIVNTLALMEDEKVDIGTVGTPLLSPADQANPNIVKIVGSPCGPHRLRGLYFTRAAAPWGEGPAWQHIGLYAYRRPCLEHFVRLPPSLLEQQEKLEQLRALEAGFRIDVALINSLPLSVDTPADLERVREFLRPQ